MKDRSNNLAIIGASYLQLPLIEKAKEMGFITHVFAWAAGDPGEKAADHFYPISITETDSITEKCRKIGICGICSIATDLGNYTVNYVANRLGLPCNSMDCTIKSTNKSKMRETFRENGDPSPKFIIIDTAADAESIDLSFPVVVKPTDRSGSRGVYKAYGKDELPEAIEKALTESFEKKAVVEEYVDGKEFSVEGISFHGEHRILAITEKFTTGEPFFIEKGHREPADLDNSIRDKAYSVVCHALDSLGVKNSASHTEIKIDAHGNIRIIEIGSRMGGDCIGSDLVPLSTGIDYMKAVIQVACGQRPDLTPSDALSSVEVRYILSKDDADEFNRIKAEEPERLIRVAEEVNTDALNKTTSSADRAGCYLVFG